MSSVLSVDALQRARAAEPFNRPVGLDAGFTGPALSNADLRLVAATTSPASRMHVEWDATADEPVPGFDIHLGVYAID